MRHNIRMRLLSKPEIDTRKSIERKQSVDEGLKIAKSIDRLREARANEESSLEKFRHEILQAIMSDIKVKTGEKAALEAEVITLRQEAEILRIPLDSEWEKVRGERVVLSSERKEAEEEAKKLREREVLLREREQALIGDRLSVEDVHRQTQEAIKKAATIKDSAELQERSNLEEFQKMQQERTGIHQERVDLGKQKEIQELSLLARETQIGYKERKLEGIIKRLNIRI